MQDELRPQSSKLVTQREKPRDPGDATLQSAEALRRLQEILGGTTAQRVERMEHAFRDYAPSAEALARHLPNAVRMRVERDQTLNRALQPVIESTIQESVRRDPQVLAEAIYPALGPAIRRSIRSAMAAMVQSFNQALEASLTPRGLRWRFEAWRTQRPYGEVVLLKSLVYRVEQVFLIHAESGILLSHVQAPAVAAEDPELVSGMLSAIRDFVTDSFHPGQDESLRRIAFGDLTLEIVAGGRTALAAAVRGIAPTALRDRLQETLESVQVEMANEVADFSGDVAPFQRIEPALESCLTEQSQERSSSLWAPVLVVTALLALIGFLTWRWTRPSADELAWGQSIAQLRDEPGIIVLDEQFSPSGSKLDLLRDAGARDPLETLSAHGVDVASVDCSLSPYYASEPALVRARVQRVLAPPEGVSLEVAAGHLSASGRAPHEWLAAATERAASVPGITSHDLSRVVDADLEALSSAIWALEHFTVDFTAGSDELQLGSQELDGLRASYGALLDSVEALGKVALLQIRAGATASERAGSPDLDDRRGERVRELFETWTERRALLDVLTHEPRAQQAGHWSELGVVNFLVFVPGLKIDGHDDE